MPLKLIKRHIVNDSIDVVRLGKTEAYRFLPHSLHATGQVLSPASKLLLKLRPLLDILARLQQVPGVFIVIDIYDAAVILHLRPLAMAKSGQAVKAVNKFQPSIPGQKAATMKWRVGVLPERMVWIPNKMRRGDNIIIHPKNFVAENAFGFAFENQSHNRCSGT